MSHILIARTLANNINKTYTVDLIAKTLSKNLIKVVAKEENNKQDDNKQDNFDNEKSNISNISNEPTPHEFIVRMLEQTAKANEGLHEKLGITFPVIDYERITRAQEAAASVDEYMDNQRKLSSNIPIEVSFSVLAHSKDEYKSSKLLHLLAKAAAADINKTKEVAEGEPDDPAREDNKLLILIDPDSAKLVQRVFADYVSEDDLSKFAQFLLSFDKLLFKFRDGKPLEREEIEELEEIEEARAQKKRQRRASRSKKKKNIKPNDDSYDEEGNEDLEEVEVASVEENAGSYNAEVVKAFNSWMTSFVSEPIIFSWLTLATANLIRAGNKIQDILSFFRMLTEVSSFKMIGMNHGNILLENKLGINLEVKLPVFDNKPVVLLSESIRDSSNNVIQKVLVKIPRLAATRILTAALESYDKTSYGQHEEYIKSLGPAFNYNEN